MSTGGRVVITDQADRASAEARAIRAMLEPNRDSPFDLLMNPHNPMRPAEWAPIPEELLVRLAPKGALVMTPEARATLNRIALGEWFVIKNFDSAHCEECRPGGRGSRSRLLGAVHDYVSIQCVPSPFNGLRQIIWWMEDVERRNDMKPGTMLQRLEEYSIFRPADETFHPISEAKAQELMAAIRQRGGRPVIDQCPPRPRDLDANLIRRRIAERASRWRAIDPDAAYQAGFR
jgi:hypothetical protein